MSNQNCLFHYSSTSVTVTVFFSYCDLYFISHDWTFGDPPLPPTSNMISMTFTSLIANKLFRFSGSYDWIIKNSFSQAEYIHKCANCVRSEKELFLHLCFILWVSPTIHLSLMVIPYEIFSPCPSPKIIKTFEEKIIYDLKSSFLVVKFLFMATVLFILDKCRGQEILSELNALKFMISFNR